MAKESSFKKYVVIGILGTIAGWYFHSHIDHYFSQIRERTECLKEMVGCVNDKGNEVKPDGFKKNVDEPIISIYERIFGKKEAETIDHKVSQD